MIRFGYLIIGLLYFVIATMYITENINKDAKTTETSYIPKYIIIGSYIFIGLIYVLSQFFSHE